MIFLGVSEDGDHGYIFVQEVGQPTIQRLFPDMREDDRFPCPELPRLRIYSK